MQVKPETALVWFSPNIEIATLGFSLRIQAGMGYWTVYYPSSQSFMITASVAHIFRQS